MLGIIFSSIIIVSLWTFFEYVLIYCYITYSPDLFLTLFVPKSCYDKLYNSLKKRRFNK